MMISTIHKARKSKERKRIEAMLAKESAKIKKAFQKYIDSFEDEAILAEIANALDTGNVDTSLDTEDADASLNIRNIDTALKIMESHISVMSNIIPEVFISAATAETEFLAVSLGSAGTAGVGVGFDPTNPRAAAKMRENRMQFVKEFSDKQRDASRQALTRAFAETGTNPRATARAFVKSMGLTATQEEAVNNYQRLLQSNSSAALDRGLRARRYDSMVERAIKDKEPLSEAQIARMTEQYRKNYLRYRAEVIARTESLRATSTARQEAAIQVVEDTGMDPDRVVRTWGATNDARTRDIHADMDGQEVGLEEPFIDGAGNELMYPGDPSAPEETTIQCRCDFSIRIKSLDEM